MYILKIKHTTTFFFLFIPFLALSNTYIINHNFWNVLQGSGYCHSQYHIKNVYTNFYKKITDNFDCKFHKHHIFCEKKTGYNYSKVRKLILFFSKLLCPPKITFKFFPENKKIMSAIFFQNNFIWIIIYIKSYKESKTIADYQYAMSIHIINKKYMHGDIVYDGILNKLKKENIIDF